MYEYIYPQNLTESARLWLWNLRDIAVIGAAAIVSVVSVATIRFMLPIALTAVFAFLTTRLDDVSVLDFIKRAVRFFLTEQQYFEWRLKHE